MKSTKKFLLTFLLVFGLAMLLSAAASASPAETESITFAQPSFGSTDGFTLSGNASLDSTNNRITVVPAATDKAGGAFTANKVAMGADGFSLAAQIYCGDKSNGPGAGFAMVLSRDGNTCAASTGNGVGYIDPSMTNSIAAGFITNDVLSFMLAQNGSYSAFYPSSAISVPSSGYVYCWLDYNASSKLLYIYFGNSSTRPASPTASWNVDLSGYSSFYVGMTASTSGYYQEYALSQLYYDDAYHSDSLSLDGSVSYPAHDSVLTGPASDVTVSSATLSGAWGSDYAASNQEFQYYNDGDAANVFSAAVTDGTTALSGLSANTKYYYRAYTDETHCGDWLDFTTLDYYTVSVPAGCYIGDDTTVTSLDVEPGDEVTVTAPEVAGKIFTGWSDGSTTVSSANPYTFAPTGDITLTPVNADGFAGSGTEADPYQITNEADLIRLAGFVNSGNNFDGKHFLLTQSVTMSDTDFIPIGNSAVNCFKGIFDCGSNAIANLHVNGTNAGLFGFIDGATIKNLIISSANIVGTDNAAAIAANEAGNCTISGCSVIGSAISSGSNTGGIIGNGCKANSYYTTVSNCTVSGCTFSGSSSAGGIVGGAYFININDCVSYSNIINNSGYAGGIIGDMELSSTVSCCQSINCNVTGQFISGGIAAYSYKNCTFRDCTVNGLISYAADNAGGITGYADTGNNIYYCTVTLSDIDSRCCSGGIAGFIYNNADVRQCFVYGGNVTVSAPYSGYAGGIISELYSSNVTANISNCKATCSVSSSGSFNQYAGGIIGDCSNSTPTIANCEYNGEVSASSTGESAFVGGIVGYSEFNTININHCVAYGTVYADSTKSNTATGGILGFGSGNDVQQTLSNNVAMQYSLSSTVGAGYTAYASSLIGYDADSATISQNYANAEMTGIISAPASVAAQPTALADMDSAFWQGLGFTANGWELTDSTATNATAEAHLSPLVTAILTIPDNLVASMLGMPLSSNGDGTYKTYVGAEITMEPADDNYRIGSMSVDGEAISKPWSFTVTGSATVSAVLTEYLGDYWFYENKYIFGKYPEDSTVDDFDWTDATVNSSTNPLNGTYDNANIYVFGCNDIFIDELDLGSGSIISYCNGSGLFLNGIDGNSHLAANSLLAECESDDVSVSSLELDLQTIWIYDSLYLYSASEVTADTVTIFDNCCGAGVYGGSSLICDTFSAAEDPYYNDNMAIYLDGNSYLQANSISGTLGVNAINNSLVNITNDLNTNYIDLYENTVVNIGGDLNVANSDDGVYLCGMSRLNVGGDLNTAYHVSIYEYAMLDVSGAINVDDALGIDTYSYNCAVFDATAAGDIPYFNSEIGGSAYIRTTLTGLPANTMMMFATSADQTTYDMQSFGLTKGDGTIVIWLRCAGDYVQASVGNIVYTGDDIVGCADNTIAMAQGPTITAATITADVPDIQPFGQPIIYGNVKVTSAVGDLSANTDHIFINLCDPWGSSVDEDEALWYGTYHLIIAYYDEENLTYGVATYLINAEKELLTVSFDANGGNDLANRFAQNGGSITLPTPTQSGYNFTGWSDGANIYAAGSSYTVTDDVTLVAQWTAIPANNNNSDDEEYTITASAGAGGNISPSGNIKVEEGDSQTFTITANAGYVIDDVLVDGKSVGAIAKYTFSNVTTGHTIKATFVAGEEETNLTDQYIDLEPGAWYIEGIEFVLEQNLFKGTSLTRYEFSPNLAMSRGMLVTVLWRLNNQPDMGNGKSGVFSDVAENLWYTEAVEWAAANDIVAGFGNNHFRPDESLTREQLAVILYNFAKFKGYDTTQTGSLANYTDSGNVSDWADAAMAWANATGLITGRTDTTLAPNGTATRAEVATILMRFVEYYTK